MNCIAIDDEPLALELIEDFCSKIAFLDLIATCESAYEALDIMKEQTVDLIFIDINMPQITGLDFIRSLINPPLTIFTTAYSEYAIEGFELNAVDYLVKPIPFNRFFKAVNKAYELYILRQKEVCSVTVPESDKKDDSYIILKVDYTLVKVNMSDIKYIEGVKDYVKIVVKDRVKSYVTRLTMKSLDEKLSNNGFTRVHKSFIISLMEFDKIENNRIYFGDKLIPIGESYKTSFNSMLKQKMLH